ncbi:competence/damage-inducible protein A [Candidatus Aerophobetes bacterium]|nr:competence/damage-inducible protein A [Candidatus Aerophobetes bacterium]
MYQDKKAEIISVGTEILLGQIVDTNSAYLARQLALLGINLFRKTVVGDNAERIKEAAKEALKRSDILILTGGLGPTQDDLTKEAVSELLGKKLLLNEKIAEQIQNKIFHHHRRISKEAVFKQAMIPSSARVIPNRVGTAPGIIFEENEKTIILLPGVPQELKVMVEEEVVPYFSAKIPQKEVIKSRVLKVWGIGESEVERTINSIIDEQFNPTVALLAKREGTCIRITAKFTPNRVNEEIKRVENKIREKLGNYIYGVDEQTMESVVGSLLKRKGLTLSLAESCSGGLLSHRVTNVPGSSDYYFGGVVSYSNEVKCSLLGVPEKLIREKGAVSEGVAKQMAKGARKVGKAHLGIGITGIAGPGGGTSDKPVGLVYIALSSKKEEVCEKFMFSGGREMIKWRASQSALNMLRKYLTNNG